MTFTTGRLPDRRYRLLHIAEVEPTRWIELELDVGGASADPWGALGRGLTLRLPTVDEHRATVAAIEAEGTERADAAESARRDAFSGRRALTG